MNWARIGVLLSILFLLSQPAAAATRVPALRQGVTTAAIHGTVRVTGGGDPNGVRAVVRNAATGFTVEVLVRNGRFFVQGLEPGGPYVITLRRIGSRAVSRDIGFVSLGEPVDVQLEMEPVPVLLDSVITRAAPSLAHADGDGGTATRMGDSLLHRLPGLNRDLYDFMSLVPQISTRVGIGSGGISGGGVGFRLNHFLTNGVPDRSLAGAQPPEFAGGKSLPFEAVAEYQVLLAPFDVRYGDFAGATINSVSRTGNNTFHGSALAQFRNDDMSRGGDPVRNGYARSVYGASLSGPIARDRAHFLFASEFQEQHSPMPGPYIGQPSSAVSPVPVRDEELARLASIMQQYGLQSGSGGSVTNSSSQRNLFARLDANIPAWQSRVALWASEATTRTLTFARGVRDTTFALTSQASTLEFTARTAALQLHSALPRPGGGHNELFLSGRLTSAGSSADVRQPIITVAVPSASGVGVIAVTTGTPLQAQTGDAENRDVNVRDNLSLPIGQNHVVTAGIEAEWFRIAPGGLQNSYGSWNFLSLDSLSAGIAEHFDVTRNYGGGNVPLSGKQYAVHVGDQWQLGSRVRMTLGVRGDLLHLDARAPYNRAVDSIFGRRTDRQPDARVEWSPRVGFTWLVRHDGVVRIRGGTGLFAGRPPLAWLHMPRFTYGTGSGMLRCGRGANDQGPAPVFNPDPLSPPAACASGNGTTPVGDVELLDSRLRIARALKSVLAVDWQARERTLVTLEALTTRGLSDFAFFNANLLGPQGIDRDGRVMYGTVDATGRATAALIAPTFPGVIELRNVSANRATQLSARLGQRFANGHALTASYTWTRARDVQTPLRVNNRGTVNWSSRALSDRHENPSTGISQNDIPHRVTLAGTLRAPWNRWSTEMAFLYVGESGSPFTYRAFGLRTLGDLNADGSNANDPIRVPRNALDPDEIQFIDDGAGTTQQAAFERFIESTPCLRQQRGRILARNSCREPWSNTTVLSLRQRIPLRQHGVELQLDAFNMLNLLNRNWGLRRIAAPAVLEHVGQRANQAGGTQPVFRFRELSSPWTIDPAESEYQLQLGIAYRF